MDRLLNRILEQENKQLKELCRVMAEIIEEDYDMPAMDVVKEHERKKENEGGQVHT